MKTLYHTFHYFQIVYQFCHFCHSSSQSSLSLFTISSKLGSKSHQGGAWEVGADFNASGYSDVYKDGLNEVRPKNIAYLACRRN